VRSAHDIAEGGIAVALAECCVANRLGAWVTLPAGLDPFAEALGRAFIVSGAPEALAGLDVIGTVGGDSLSLDGIAELAVSEIVAARERRLEQPLLG
jgi:phosphoribosylformylglycinamidine synthase subunit PurL